MQKNSKPALLSVKSNGKHKLQSRIHTVNPFGTTCKALQAPVSLWHGERWEGGRDPWLQAIHTTNSSGEMGGEWVKEQKQITLKAILFQHHPIFLLPFKAHKIFKVCLYLVTPDHHLLLFPLPLIPQKQWQLRWPISSTSMATAGADSRSFWVGQCLGFPSPFWTALVLVPLQAHLPTPLTSVTT